MCVWGGTVGRAAELLPWWPWLGDLGRGAPTVGPLSAQDAVTEHRGVGGSRSSHVQVTLGSAGLRSSPLERLMGALHLIHKSLPSPILPAERYFVHTSLFSSYTVVSPTRKTPPTLTAPPKKNPIPDSIPLGFTISSQRLQFPFCPHGVPAALTVNAEEVRQLPLYVPSGSQILADPWSLQTQL